MTPNRHCEEVSETAALYALGKLPEAEARSFERRIASGCGLCQAELESHQRTSEILLTAAVSVVPPASLEERLMRGIRSEPNPSHHPGQLLRADEGDWVPSPDPGVSYRFLHGKRTVLVRMAPGARCSTHQHAFDENCLVLEGTVEDGDMKLNTGDFLFMPAGTTHSPSYSETGCVLLISYA